MHHLTYEVRTYADALPAGDSLCACPRPGGTPAQQGLDEPGVFLYVTSTHSSRFDSKCPAHCLAVNLLTGPLALKILSLQMKHQDNMRFSSIEHDVPDEAAKRNNPAQEVTLRLSSAQSHFCI